MRTKLQKTNFKKFRAFKSKHELLDSVSLVVRDLKQYKKEILPFRAILVSNPFSVEYFLVRERTGEWARYWVSIKP